MASIKVYYKNGDIEEFITTPLPFQDGYLIQNEFLQLHDIENDGILWERSFFATEQEDPEGLGATIRQIQIVAPDKLPQIEVIFVDNMQVYPKPEDTNDEDNNNTESSNSNNKPASDNAASDLTSTKTDADTSSAESETAEETEVIISKAVETEQPDTSTDNDIASPIPEDDSPIDFTPTDEENIDYSSLLGSYLSDLEADIEENSNDEDQ